MSFTYGDRDFATRLKEKLAEVTDQKTAELANGNATDFAGYRERVGFIMAIKFIGRLAEDIERAMRS